MTEAPLIPFAQRMSIESHKEASQWKPWMIFVVFVLVGLAVGGAIAAFNFFGNEIRK